MNRPMPPTRVLDSVLLPVFEPSAELAVWARETFISETSPLVNEQHAHLAFASIGFVWTNVENIKKGRIILGQCQLMPPTGDKWSAGRASSQIVDWFGFMPDFLITIYAIEAANMSDRQFMALVEHELSHAAQATDEFGAPKFDKMTGAPVWATKGHDFEEFVGVVRRYGSTSPELAAIMAMAAAGDEPEIGDALITGACGTCI